jgi:hypothetical protein
LDLRKFIPPFIKPLLRFIRYSQERRKVFRNFEIKKSQNASIGQLDLEASSLIVFVVPGLDWSTSKEPISGGVMSIASIYEETLKLNDLHNAQTVMCTHTNDCLLIKFNRFENSIPIFRFEQLAISFGNVKEVIIHLPEYMTSNFITTLHKREKEWLANKNVHYNILIQSIRIAPSVEAVRCLLNHANKVTVTTAHEKYSSPFYRKLYDVPLHKFSTWVSPEQYYFRTYINKDNLIVVSPDEHPIKDSIIDSLQKIPNLTVRIIQNLTYGEYKQLISRAKWSLTFGEGLDGYLIEPIFSGAIGFAIYNDDFFTEDFKQFHTIYKTIVEMENEIVTDIQSLDSEVVYEKYQKEQFVLCAKHYSESEYKKNIASFYKGEYTYE